MADPSRLEDLRRRVQRDPASLVFAQLAEEHRRAGEHHEAVRVCRAGLRHHPEYHSARVTLGRALLALGQLPEAQCELEAVLRVAPENIAARRDLGELFRREDRLPEALAQLRSALALAPQDAELAASVDALERSLPSRVEPVHATAPAPVHSPEAVPHAPALVFTTHAVTDAPPSVPPVETTRMLARLEGWLARLEADRRNRDRSAAGE